MILIAFIYALLYRNCIGSSDVVGVLRLTSRRSRLLRNARFYTPPRKGGDVSKEGLGAVGAFSVLWGLSGVPLLLW